MLTKGAHIARWLADASNLTPWEFVLKKISHKLSNLTKVACIFTHWLAGSIPTNSLNVVEVWRPSKQKDKFSMGWRRPGKQAGRWICNEIGKQLYIMNLWNICGWDLLIRKNIRKGKGKNDQGMEIEVKDKGSCLLIRYWVRIGSIWVGNWYLKVWRIMWKFVSSRPKICWKKSQTDFGAKNSMLYLMCLNHDFFHPWWNS